MDERDRDRAGEEETPVTWGMRLQRRNARPPRRFVLASVLLHAAVIGGMWLAGVRLRPTMPDFVQYRVTLISPPAQVFAPEPEPVETTAPVVVEPEPPPPEPQPTPPKPTPPPPQTQAPRPAPVQRTPDPAPARGPDPKPVTVGGENLNVNIEGAEFPYPDYLENVVLQLKRYFRWNGPANLQAEVVFYIQRDGAVGGTRVVGRSGNFNFDIQVVEAVDQAGKARAFGPLPGGWQGDRLWISFTFKPES
jgi:periplasmic protein TonB